MLYQKKPNQDKFKLKASTQQEWRDELLRAGIRGKGGQRIEFSRVESHPYYKMASCGCRN